MSGKILLVHHFSLRHVTGVRALLGELLWRIPEADPGTAVAFEAYDGHPDAASFLSAVAARHADATSVIAVNGHVDFRLDYTIGLLKWAARTGRGAHLYVHDFWPQHGPLLHRLTSRYRCGLLASTDLIHDAMAADGLESVLVQVGIPLMNVEPAVPAVRNGTTPRVVGSIGRVVPRKRFRDVVAAFGAARLGDRALLHLRLLASGVRDAEEDDRVVAAIEAEGRRHDLGESLQILRVPTDRADYRGYDLYVCASSYEGFSMTPIEAAYGGCPPLMSDIPAHRAIAASLFPDDPDAFLFPVGDTSTLGRLMADEVETGRRGMYVRSRLGEIRAVVEARWSPARAAAALLEVGGHR